MVLIFLIFIISLAFRLFLSPLGFHIDIMSNAGWGQWIYNNGPLGFYENGIWTFSWPTQPPFVSLLYGFDNHLYIFLLELFRDIGHAIVKYHLAPGHMIWWFNFTKWFDTARISPEANFMTGYLVTIKLLPILSDLGIAAVIYWIAKSVKKVKYPALWAAIYLFSPFSWYLSSLWGQYDQLAFLPVLLSFVLVSQRKLNFLSPFLFALSIAIKPTSLILLPYFFYIYLKNKQPRPKSPRFSHPSGSTSLFTASLQPRAKSAWFSRSLNKPTKFSIIISFILISLFFYTTTQVFTEQNIFYFTKNTLVEKIFFKSASRLSVNAFNFWRLPSINGLEPQSKVFLFIPASYWSFLAFIVLNLVAINKSKIVNLKNVFTGAFLISAGAWIFMTNMLDRYFFAGIVTGLIVCIFYRKVFFYWLILSFIFLLNLYNQWWFPSYFQPVEIALTWHNMLLTKLLTIINIFAFFKITKLLK